MSRWTVICNECGTRALVSECSTWAISFWVESNSYCPPCTTSLGEQLLAEAGLRATSPAARALTPAGETPPPRPIEIALHPLAAVARFRGWVRSLPAAARVLLDLGIGG